MGTAFISNIMIWIENNIVLMKKRTEIYPGLESIYHDFITTLNFKEHFSC